MDISVMDVVVFAAMAFAAVFVIAWSVSPALRSWIERPKYRFQKNVQTYDQFTERNHP